MGIVVLIVYWVSVARLWILDGPQHALIFVALWVLGAIGSVMLHLHGGLFVAYQAVLAVFLLMMIKYKSA